MSNLVVLTYVMPDNAAVTDFRLKNGTVALDASLQETHGVSATITTHPVETGSAITDNYRPQPLILSLTGLVTNTPIAAPPTPNEGVTAIRTPMSAQVITRASELINVQWSSLQFSAQFDRVKAVYGALVNAALAGAIFGVHTTLEDYTNMLITQFSVPRDAGHGSINGVSTSIQIGITFQQIVLVDTQLTEALPGSIASKHLGNKVVTPVEPNSQHEQTISTARKLMKAAGF